MSRKTYSREFKVSAVKLVNEQGYTPRDAAVSLGVDPQSVKAWVEKLTPEVGRTPESEPARLRAQLKEARDQLKRITMERDILKKATAFFARHST